MTPRAKLTLERTFDASPEDVWELWTTRDGMEAWMGPEGFDATVRELDLRPGGHLVYAMTAVGLDQVEFLTKAGLPLVSVQRVRIVEVEAPRRLVTREVADFIPGVEPYEVETVVEMHEVEDGTHVVMTFDAMHDAHWTEMSRLGRESELRKLADLLAARE
ncbi:MAG TPA: SRPBCC domain-containing protein [Candidatus Dormibacteraeota bacterium]|nr:SRPBCC domain-containing protein [Candidatus Dormibacteraeota bacterium]